MIDAYGATGQIEGFEENEESKRDVKDKDVILNTGKTRYTVVQVIPKGHKKHGRV